mmetsp:Transcript_12851/g.41976  ORF Transcript_12851/g.41976 Transcript_12851/m.41976 type:complete len:238 (-) Transcript_12851:109-822(-)|eukprot:CAMPEP_0118904494 /NCGR_PEP_ID=MMETSP1166-20130328/8934_1 /TAXON_ID=1104430 /ORGANISM="Chrysoreinhardia sp, Strain CCMP3193" /LENGTH=237 /DNA_ID=CAMNT_0006843751 /DNA_START=3 /DNA_END=716 /DNA_ORIENTATION=+
MSFVVVAVVAALGEALSVGPSSSRRAHLVWSPGVAPKTVAAYTGLALVRHALPQVSTPAPAVALGFLSSSCCLLQLALNAASIGCAGFNVVLGPLRPFFLALTAHVHRRTSPGLALLAAAITFTPEALALLERTRRRRMGSASIVIDLPTMGCVACVDAVARAVRAVDGVASASIELFDDRKGGRAIIDTVHPSDFGSSSALGDQGKRTLRDVPAAVIAACEAAGFPGGRLLSTYSS